MDIKGIVLAGGTGTRMGTISRVINKHCNLIYRHPMILYPISVLKKCGIENIMVVVSEYSAGQIINILGDGSDYGVNISYGFQKEPLGIADALGTTRKYTDNKPIVVILGDNFFDPVPSDLIGSWSQTNAKIVLTRTIYTVGVFGIATFDCPMYRYEEDGLVKVCNGIADIYDTNYSGPRIPLPQFTNTYTITGVVEKPVDFIGNLMQTGIYMYDNTVWDIIDNIEPSARGEYEISDVNTEYIKRGIMEYDIYHGYWVDCGTPDALLEAANYAKEHMEIMSDVPWYRK